MRFSEGDLVAADAGAALLNLASRVQALSVGPLLAATIRGTCLDLPFVLDADVDLSGATTVPADGLWSHRYDLAAGPERIGVLRIRVADPLGFAPIDRMLRDVAGLLGLGIANHRLRDRFDVAMLQRGEELAERRLALEHHIAENARLAEIVRHSLNPTYVMDLDFRIVWLNQPFLDTFGLTWEQVIGRRPSEVLAGDDGPPAYIAEIREALQRVGFYEGELTNRDRHGIERIFSARMHRFRSEDGRHEGYVSIRVDITERRRAERALAASEARFRDLTATASDWFWETDVEHRFVTMAGRPSEDHRNDLRGRTRWDVAGADLTSELWRGHLDDVAHRRPFRDLRYPVRWPDGTVEYVAISGRPMFDGDGRFLGYRGTGRDVTAEVEAREAVDRMIRALDTIDEVVALFDAEERLVFANRPYKSIHPEIADALRPGITMPEILAELGRLGVIENAAEAIPDRLARFRNPSGPFHMRRMGRWFRANEQKLDDGGTILIATDVTEGKEAEFELLRAKTVAEDANAAKSNFLARMSHELRTPLNAILGLSEMLILMEARLSEAKRREYLGDVMQAGRILLSHIEDILHFTRLDAGGFAVHPRPIDPRRAVAEAMRLMRAVARARSIRLEVALARGLPSVLADPRSVRQILVNLIGNAIKFSPPRSVVRVTVVSEGDRLRVAVLDHGIGIPADQQESIFEPFHQVGDPSVAAGEGGTGLGLSIVKALVERNAGSIDLHSTLGEGTTIRVAFPAVRDGVVHGMPA